MICFTAISLQKSNNNTITTGGDTVSTAMAGVFFYLSRNKHCYDELSQEIRTKFKIGSDINGGPQLESCRYLRACIDETLRMSPPIGGTLWREVADSDDKEPFLVDGHIVPPGTHVGVNIYSIHHNEEYFPNPFTFSPERWLGNGQNNSHDSAGQPAQNRAFVPFSVGMRSCAGKTMAYLETSLLIAKTVWYFDFERCEGSLGDVGGGKEGAPGGRGRPNEFQLYDVITSRHDGPWLKFIPREEHCESLR
jgi:cytochrome P450